MSNPCCSCLQCIACRFLPAKSTESSRQVDRQTSRFLCRFLPAKSTDRRVDFYCRFLPAKSTDRRVDFYCRFLPAKSTEDRRVDFYCRFLPAESTDRRVDFYCRFLPAKLTSRFLFSIVLPPPTIAWHFHLAWTMWTMTMTAASYLAA